jgi:acyl-homoserine-lactone acylase
MIVGVSRTPLAALLLLGSLSSVGCGDDSAASATYHATVRWTENRVPHVLADDVPSAAFGQGYAFAGLGGCVLADQVVKVRSERASFFGPGPSGVFVDSDFAHLALGIYEEARALYPQQPEDVRAVIAGYVAGYNRYLRLHGASLPCAGQPWLRPISELDLFAYYLELSTFASGRALQPLILAAQPPTVAARTMPTLSYDEIQAHRPGSNGWAIGSERSANGQGMLLANPHFPWEGELKLYESHLRVPGQLDVYGASLMGVVGVLIGFNQDVAWTHTVSNGKRFVLYELQLDPSDPTRYIYDGQSRAMDKRVLEVSVKQADGTLAKSNRTFYRTHWGPMVMLPPVGWTTQTAFTVRDTNASNPAIVSQILSSNRADSLESLQRVHDEVSGLPWVNTMAVDRQGRAWYVDSSATPDLSAETQAAWTQRTQTDLLTGLLAASGLVLLPGNDSRFEWVEEPGARTPGLVPVAKAPRLERRDFVFNSNDSHWLTNPLAPLTGFSLMYGPERTPRTPRTRMNATMLLDEDGSWSGADRRFDLDELGAAVFSNRGLVAEQLRDAVVARCRTATAPVPYQGAAVELGGACDALAAWDLRLDLGSTGALLWREFLGEFSSEETKDAGALWAQPFDPGAAGGDALAAVRTPRGLAAAVAPLGEDRVLRGLAGAVVRLRQASLSVTSSVGAGQFAARGGGRIGIHGGIEREGVINLVIYTNNLLSTATPARPRGPLINPETGLTSDGYVVNTGSSFVMAMQFTERGPKARALLTYGQSDNQSSPYYVDQTRRFSAKQWREVAIDEVAIASDPALLVEEVSEPYTTVVPLSTSTSISR